MVSAGKPNIAELTRLTHTIAQRVGRKGTLGDSQELSVEEAIRVFTFNSAYALGAEDRIGSIEASKLADFIVLHHNLLEIDPTEIRDTVVERTVMSGRIVYDRDRDLEPDVFDESHFEKAGRIVH